MNTVSRFFLLAGLCFLMVVPAQAQRVQGSDVSGNVPLSDQSGVAVNSDAVFFQSDEAKIRMQDAASSLAQALQSGQLGSSVLGGNQSTTVSLIAIDLFSSSSRKTVTAAKQAFIAEMTAGGLSNENAKSLANAIAGFLDGGTITSSQFQTALNAYNAAVDAAPAGFLAQPPHEFIVVRAVLTTLLESVA